MAAKMPLSSLTMKTIVRWYCLCCCNTTTNLIKSTTTPSVAAAAHSPLKLALRKWVLAITMHQRQEQAQLHASLNMVSNKENGAYTTTRQQMSST